MSVNIYDTANKLEQDIRQTDQYAKLETAFNELQANEESSKLYEEFRQVQQEIQSKQMTGQEITEEDAKNAQELSDQVNNNEHLTNLINAEKELSALIEEINQIVLKPVQDLYQSNQ